MGFCCSKEDLVDEVNILVLGLSGSGKTEILHVLVNEQRTDTSPTNGSRVFTRQLGKFRAVFTEIGGNHDMRKIWSHYYHKAHAIIYVFDLSKEWMVNESCVILKDLIKHNHVKGKPILMIANKTDICPLCEVFEIYRYFPLESIARKEKMHILLQCCGFNDYIELFSAIDWLRFRIELDYENLKDRVKRDIALENGGTQPPSLGNSVFTIAQVHGLIYVVDLANEDIMNESYQTLVQVIKNSYIQGKSMLVLANKTDLCEYPDILDFYERFPLESLANLYQTHILLQCCGHNDYTELYSGIDWLRFRIEFEYEQLKTRITADTRLEKTKKEPPSEIRRLGAIGQVRSYFGRPRSAPCIRTSTSNIRAKSAEGRIIRYRYMLRTNRIHIADEPSSELPSRSNNNKHDAIELKPVFKINEK